MGKAMKKISGYVFQDDIFLPNLSVMEYLNFVVSKCKGRNYLFSIFRLVKMF